MKLNTNQNQKKFNSTWNYKKLPKNTKLKLIMIRMLLKYIFI